MKIWEQIEPISWVRDLQEAMNDAVWRMAA